MRTWGFRFSPTDGFVICAFLAVAGGLWRLGNPLWWLILIAAGHFFLFCNVFRIHRRFELAWAGLFIVNVGAWLWFDSLDWRGVLACQAPVTVVLIGLEMRQSRYHGVLAQRLNPQLGEYLAGRI